MVARVHITKRFRMERPLAGALPSATLDRGFRLVPWHDRWLEAHARVMHRSFAGDFDSRVFPCFRTLDGCLELISAMRGLPGFCPEATWLVAAPEGFVGSTQGLLTGHRFGTIQNIGLAPAYRGRGLGSALLAAALGGFRRSGATRAALEVTATNEAALALYRKFGFRTLRPLYTSTTESREALV
jgi:GNAT superfamily N-acetyltransferase